MNKFKRFLAAFLAVLMLIGTVPLSSFAAPASDIPAEMLDNVYLDALAYTGYKVQAQKDDGTIFKKYAWMGCDAYLSGITYDNSFSLKGTETVSDSSTVTGQAPDIAKFKKTGLCCASYVSYVYFNYLVNIAGYDMSAYERPSSYQTADSLRLAAEKWASAGLVKKISFTQSSDGKTFKPNEEIPIGSLVAFKDSSGACHHVALYAGEYNGKHFVTHTGNNRGPEIHIIEEMEKNDGMQYVWSVYSAPVTKPKGSIEIYKKDPNGKNLSGARFTATNDETGDVYDIGPTDNDGFASKGEIPYGNYTVKETVFPKNYTSYGQTEWHITVDSSNKGVATINAVNAPATGNVALKKTADDGIVDGFKFRLHGTSDIGTAVDVTGTTANGGNLNFNNIYVGTYTIEEIEVPAHIISPTSQTVKVVEGETTPVSFNNSPKRVNVSIEKQSSLTGETLSGAAFKVQQWSKSANAYVDYKILTETKVNGKTKYVATDLMLTADNAGKFKLVETGVPHGYTNKPVFTSSSDRISANGEFQFDYDSNVTGKTFNFIAKNAPSEGSVALTKTSENGKVDGFKFHLYGTADIGVKVDEYGTSDKSGKINFKNIYIGTYTIEEVELPSYYITPAKKTVKVVEGVPTPVSFENNLKRGDLVVTKTAEDGLVENVKLWLHGTSDSGIEVSEYRVTNAQGRAEFKDILIGSNYTLEEVNTAIRYVVPAKQTLPIEWNKVTNAKVDNVLKKFRVQVSKIDAETRSPQGDASLAGAVYGIYNNGVLVDKYTTDANGQFTTKEYICGDKWTVKEISPSPGYLLDDSVYKIGAEPELYTVEHNEIPIEVVEGVIYGSIAIIKHTDDGSTQIETPEVGAEFELYLKKAGSYAKAKETERDILVCDENGYAASKEVPFGLYTVHQTKGWDGRELISDFDVFISKHGQVYPFLINNSNFGAYLKIVKIDAETGKAIPYAGAGFQIYDPEGNLVEHTFTYPTPTTIDTFYTNSEGYLVTPEKLPFGSGYRLVEVEAPYGYVLDSTPIFFDIKQEDSTKEDTITVIQVERPNIPQKGIIEITKTGEVFSSVTNSNDIYTPAFAEQGLANAIYEIYALEDVITPEGTVRATEGELVDTVITGEDGTGSSKSLYLGKYLVKEATAPDTFVLNSDEYIVELVYAGQEVDIISTALSFYNERQKAEISLLKVLDQDDNYGIGMNSEIFSVQFGIFAAEEITAADGSIIPVDGLITFANCNENGSITFDCDLPIGFRWYAQEIATNEQYILSNDKYEFDTEYQGQDIEVIDININNGEAIENELKYGSVQGIKVGEADEPLSGALIGIFAPDTDKFTEKTAIETVISAADGSFAFENVPFGEWIVREIEAPTGYVLDSTQHHVYISDDGAVINIRIENEKIYGNFEITKTDVSTGEALPDVGFKIYDKDKNVIAEGYTDKSGKFTVEALVYGDYYYQEFSCSDKYVLDDSLYPFSIKEDGVTVKAKMTNRMKRSSFEIKKIDEATGAPMPGVGFRIYDSEFNILAEGYTDENGIVRFEDLCVGDYYYEEFFCSDAYVLDDMLYEFSITGDGQITTVEVTNRMKQGKLVILKVDPEDSKKVLEGVVFVIEDENGNFIAEITTDKNSRAEIDLPIGKYVVYEKSTIKGYVLSRTKYKFSITDDGQIVELKVENRKANPQSPNTGNPFEAAFWLTKSIGSAVLISGAAFLIRKRKEKSDAIR